MDITFEWRTSLNEFHRTLKLLGTDWILLCYGVSRCDVEAVCSR